MKSVISLSRKAYGIGIIGIGLLQLYLGIIDSTFVPAIFPAGTTSHILTYAWGILFTFSGILMLIGKKGYEASLLSAGIFLALLIVLNIPYLMFFNEDGHSLLDWSQAIQESAFTGSSLIFAASYCGEQNQAGIMGWLRKLIPYGGLFFAVMLIAYGTDHFVYTSFVSTMVPGWIPGHYFWTYFVGSALIGAGITIALRIRLRLVATLLAAMLLLFFILVHIPAALKDPFSNDGLELNRVFTSFGYTGTALLLAFSGTRVK